MRNFILLCLFTVLCGWGVAIAQEGDVPTIDFDGEQYLKYKKSIDSLNVDLEWKEIRDGLYINKKGEIGFIGMEVAPNATIIMYQTTFWDGEETPLKAIVDTLTFSKLGGSDFGAFYKDKNHIYHAFATTDGANFSYYDEADYKTFKVLNDSYAIDKDHVHHMRFGLMDKADPKTFKSLFYKDRYYAKDKNNYYIEDRELKGMDLNIDGIEEIIPLLDKL
ncbi:hypothetical protein FUA48_10270 [Flavobacterium alkalisoli]|uniref:Uncharacterized protein n=1 Tax=Flavobacterium alkalisoli TaxID=2602769 RepID=A0A5B9FSF5_9FLAO|nr:DKNYY domain-containing protein [Flavobacterium alkalisoli]QEE49950.1 hypothetical protein FUA48_10270 [Flavobacterium alkalisoli]